MAETGSAIEARGKQSIREAAALADKPRTKRLRELLRLFKGLPLEAEIARALGATK